MPTVNHSDLSGNSLHNNKIYLDTGSGLSPAGIVALKAILDGRYVGGISPVGSADNALLQPVFDAGANDGAFSLRLGRGTFRLNSRLNVSSSGLIDGSGMGVTILQAAQSLYVSGNDHWRGLLTINGIAGGLRHVTIRNLTIDCANQLKTQAFAVLGGSFSSGASTDWVTFDHCEFINMGQTSDSAVETAKALGQITSGRGFHGNFGNVSNIYFSHCRFGISNKQHIYILGQNVDTLHFDECEFLGCQRHSISWDEYSRNENVNASVRSHRNWEISGSHFHDNHLLSTPTSVATAHDGLRHGIVGLNIHDNHFEGRNGYDNDEIVVNIHGCWNTRIKNNFFDGCREALSLGTSNAAAYYNVSPDQFNKIEGNKFYRCHSVVDHDAAIMNRWVSNEFEEVEALNIAGYSRHFLTEYSHNTIRNCPFVVSGMSDYQASAVMLTSDGFDVHDNTIIDNLLLPDPTVAPILSQVVGGAMGSRTYYVKYSWGNITGVQPPVAPTVAVNAAAGNLNGGFLYRVTFVDAEGETNGSANSALVSPVNQQVGLTGIPTGPAGIVARRIYRRKQVNGLAYFGLVPTLNDKITTSYTDNVADNVLGSLVPRFNTTNSETMASPEASLTVLANSLLKVTLTSGNTIKIPPGAKWINVYVSTTSGSETKQDFVLLNVNTEMETNHTFFGNNTPSWTEPSAGLITGKSLPTSNTTKVLTRFGIYEQPGAFGTMGNRYQNNKFYGIPAGQEIRKEATSTYKRVSRGNISNPTMVAGAEESVEDRPTDLGNKSGVFNLDPFDGSYLKFTASGAVTPTIQAGDYKGQQIRGEINQDGEGGRTWTKTSTTKANGGTIVLSSSGGARDIYTFCFDGTNWTEVSRSLNLS